MNQVEQLQKRFEAQKHELHVHQVELEQQNEELRQTYLEAELARQQYADLFEQAPVGYVVCGQAGLIEQVNRAGCAQLGSGRPQLVGRHLSLFVDGPQRADFAALLRQALNQTELDHSGPHRRELLMLRPDGGRWDALVECTAIRGRGALNGHPARHTQQSLSARIVMTDISALKSAQREAEVRTTQARLLRLEMQTFLHSMTHDLSRPQRQIEGFAALLSKGGKLLDEHSAHLLDNLLLAVSDMGAMNTALTRFFQSGQPGGVAQRLDMGRLLDVIVHELEPERRGRQVTLTRDPLPVVIADRLSLHMVFSNLLSNALKFTRPRAEARIHVGVRSDAEYHLFSVRDNGVGFDPQHASRLFGVFERLHSDREFRGLGLGLALARRIVERYQGRIWAESVPGEGATFWVQLPVTQLPAHQESGAAAQHALEPSW